MSELKGAKMEGSKVPAEEIKNPDLVAAIEKMQDDNTTENINKMIDEVMKAKFILPAKVTPKTEAKTTNGQTVMQQSTQVQFRLLENGNKEKFFGVFITTTTSPLAFFCIKEKIFKSWLSMPRVASTIKIHTSAFSMERMERITE